MIKKILAACCIMILCITAFFPTAAVSAADNPSSSKKTVRVGVTQFSFLSDTDEEGNRTGALFEYMDMIAKYANWNIEYVDLDVESLLDKLASGEVDIIGGVNKDESTMELYDFPELSNGFIYTCILTKADQKEFIFNDYSSLDGMKIGIYSKAKSRQAEFNAFCTANNINMIPVYYDNMEDYSDALDKNEVDGLLDLDINVEEDEKMVARFSPRPYYYAVTKGNSQIVRDLNQAIELINTFEPDFNNKLYSKYIEQQNITQFTANEQKYIQDHPVIKVACLKDWRPFTYYNQKTQTYRGISIDLLEKISSLTGIQFEIIPVETFDEAINALSAGEAEIFCGTYNTDYMKGKNGLVFSIPYLTTQTVILNRGDAVLDADSMQNGVAALTRGFEKPYSFPYSDILYYDTADEAIKAVQEGVADYSIICYLASESHIRRYGSGNLVVTPITNINTSFTLAYEKDVSSVLISLMDKTIHSIDEGDLQSIILNNTIFDSPVSFSSYIYSNPNQVIIAVVSISLLLIIVLFVIMRMRLKNSQKDSLLGEAYRIVDEIADEYLFEYNYKNAQLKLPDSFCRKTGHPAILESCGTNEGIRDLFEHFKSSAQEAHSTIDFECSLPDGTTEWFRATCAILFNSHKQPIRGLGKLTSIQNEHMEKQRLEMRANTDALTGLFMKHHCEKLVNGYLSSAPPDHTIAFIMIDLDNFKQVNDTLGHLGGDAVLQHLALCLKNIPIKCISGRFGGDEFFLFVKDVANLAHLHKALKEFCEYMNQEFEYDGKHHIISISIGAVCCPAYKMDFNTLLKSADHALYTTKSNGRNNYTIVKN